MIGEHLQKMMKKRSYNLTELSRITGFKMAHLSKLKDDKINPSIQTLIKLADELHCTTDELLGRR